MGRPKGGKNREWTKEQKFDIVSQVLNGEYSATELGHKFNMSDGMICTWIKKYQQGGIEALENRHKPGNPLAKYSRRKSLTEIEQLEYENMMLRIENERLKKGYTQEDVILAKEKLLEKNTK